MEKLIQSDIDELEKVISNINFMVEDVEAIIDDERVDGVKLAYFLGKLSMKLFENRNKIQDIIDTVNDIEGWDENWPDDIDNETTDELPY